MRLFLQLISWLSLAGTIGPAILYYYDKMELPMLKTVMLAATVTWFVATALWMGREAPSDPEEGSLPESGAC